MSCSAVARLCTRLTRVFSFAAPSCVSGGPFDASLAACSNKFSNLGTDSTLLLVSSARAARKSDSSASARKARSAPMTAAVKALRALFFFLLPPSSAMESMTAANGSGS